MTKAGWPRLGRGTSRGVLLLLALTVGCDRSSGEGSGAGATMEPPETFEPVVLMDAAGRSHDFSAPPARIVSLVPSATATLIALGEVGRLAGRTDFDTAQAIAHLPSVGGGLAPNMEALLALRPDLVIRFEGPSDPGTPEQLDRLGIAHFAVRPDRIADARRTIEDLGAMTGRARSAGALVEEIDASLQLIQSVVSVHPPVRAAFLIGGSPPWVAGAGTFIHELMRIGGGVNVFADLPDLYAPVSPEELIARGADVYLLLEGGTLDPRLQRGVRVAEVGSAVQLPGPDLPLAALAVARALHPDVFP